MSNKPTIQMYTFIQNAYDFFNERLFNSELPACLLTLQREKNAMGYFSEERWEQGEGKRKIHEIALNPSFFITHKPLELMQTIVHEMVHLWQYEFGKPSHRTYHNKEWADKMESIGLMPSNTGLPGGKRTGQAMSDYPIKNGAFYFQCIAFAQLGYKLPFYDRYAKTESSQVRTSEQLAEMVADAVCNAIVAATEEKGVSAPIEEETVSIGVEAVMLAGSFDEAYAAAEASLTQPFSAQFDIDVAALTEAREQEALAKRKSVYVCQCCGDRAWGKPSLDLWCGKCKIAFVRVEEAGVGMQAHESSAEMDESNHNQI